VPLIHYLLMYDHRQQKLLQAEPYDDATTAAEAYARLEREHREDTGLEIVLISADSLDTIRLTHGNYFDGEGPAVTEQVAATHE
jgi:hypothetical protein